MSMGKHQTNKSATDPTYHPQFSGVSHAPHCRSRIGCPTCGTQMHNEGGSHYCPTCDDFQPMLARFWGEHNRHQDLFCAACAVTGFSDYSKAATISRESLLSTSGLRVCENHVLVIPESHWNS